MQNLGRFAYINIHFGDGPFLSWIFESYALRACIHVDLFSIFIRIKAYASNLYVLVERFINTSKAELHLLVQRPIYHSQTQHKCDMFPQEVNTPGNWLSILGCCRFQGAITQLLQSQGHSILRVIQQNKQTSVEKNKNMNGPCLTFWYLCTLIMCLWQWGKYDLSHCINLLVSSPSMQCLSDQHLKKIRLILRFLHEIHTCMNYKGLGMWVNHSTYLNMTFVKCGVYGIFPCLKLPCVGSKINTDIPKK